VLKFVINAFFFLQLILTPKHWGALPEVFQVSLSWNHNYTMWKIKKQIGIKSVKVLIFLVFAAQIFFSYNNSFCVNSYLV
jgi:hypothetical protein